MAITLDQLLYGIKQQETGGEKSPYTTVNSIGATGAYQVMAANIGPWSQEALGRRLTQQQFIASPADQDAIARYIIGKDFNKYGPDGAASVWYSGQPDATKTYGNPSVATYVQQVLQKALGGSVGGSTGTPAPTPPSSSGGGILDWPGEITKFFTDGTDTLATTMTLFKAFFQPATYVRLAAGWFGIIALILALIFIYKESK